MVSAPSYAPKKGLSNSQIEELITDILDEATLEEKVGMMSGKGFFEAMVRTQMVWGAEPYRAGGGIERLDVPALWFTDGPRGVARGNSTCFPASIARGAAWDRDLERRIGEAMSVEIRAQGCNLSGAVCVNLLRHPGWGRAQETYGEDPYHVGEIGAALSQGLQTHNVIATVKHFALNSIENARFKIDVKIDDRSLREVYLPHFKRILDAGCASVMSAYNKINGEYCGQHRELLTDILRHEWGFDGFVHSDWMLGVYQTYGASAGLDIENPEPVHYGDKLVKAVETGQVEPSVVDTACRRILRMIYRFACAEDPYPAYSVDMVASPAHTALALEAAEKSAVLIKNSGVLPLRPDARIGVFGKLANLANTGDFGSSRVQPPYVTTSLEGLQSYLSQPDLSIIGTEDDVAAAAKAAAGLDAAIIVVGTTAHDEGEYIPADMGGGLPLPEGAEELIAATQQSEGGTGALGISKDRGGDRERLRLPAGQVDLIKAVSAANPNTIIVIVSGSAIIPVEWESGTNAILQTFYSGMEGGKALAHLLYGEVSPSGKLPFVLAKDESDYPFFDKDADEIIYGPLHGYTLFEKNQTSAAYAFGHGLSYSSFSYRALKARRTEDGIQAQVSITNTGKFTADEIVQLYIGFPGKTGDRPLKLLRGFERLSLAPGETKTARFFVPNADLAYWSESSRDWEIEPGMHKVLAGASSEDLLEVSIDV